MNRKIERLIRKEAEKSVCRHKHGSVITFKGSILRSGRNRIKWPRASLHAEIDVILGVPRKLLPNCVLYVGRISAAGKFVNSKPCRRCTNLIRRIVKSVYYTNEEGKWTKLF